MKRKEASSVFLSFSDSWWCDETAPPCDVNLWLLMIFIFFICVLHHSDTWFSTCSHPYYYLWILVWPSNINPLNCHCLGSNLITCKKEKKKKTGGWPGQDWCPMSSMYLSGTNHETMFLCPPQTTQRSNTFKLKKLRLGSEKIIICF